MSERSAQRGRPPLADIGTLREQAIGILLRDGYAGTTMISLADEVGLSVRTLHRYFPSKADIIWGGTEHALDSLRRNLDATPADLPLLEAIIHAVVGVFAEDTDEPSLSRTRLRAIATTAHLHSTRPEAYRGWLEETATFIARRTGREPRDLAVRTASAAVQIAVMEALAHWATAGARDDPSNAVTEALSSLRLLTSSPAAPPRTTDE